MKAIDFTQPGGFPLTQDQLDYLQQAYTEATGALAAMGGDSSSPFTVSGMLLANPSTGDYTITDGWFMYNNEMIRCTAGSITGASGASAAYLVITAAASPLIYNDGSTPPVVLDKTAALATLPAATATDATHCPLSALRPFGAGFGVANRESAWQSLVVSTLAADGGVTGTVYYKKDFTANTLQIRGLLTSANAQNFAASPGSLFYLMGTLPGGYVPNNTAYFAAHYFVASSIKDDLGVGWIRQLNCGINGFGQLFVNWIKPDIATGGYGINFNAIVPLD
jgi:hypothetical protein